MNVPQDKLDHRPLGDVEYFIVHHSVTAQTLTIDQICAMEVAAQDFVTVGYHAIVRLNPDTNAWEIQEGRTIDDVPAAAYGLNEPSYDICVLGNYEPNVSGVETNEVDPRSLELVLERIAAVKAKCPNLKYLIGHRDVATIKAKQGQDPSNFSTECPGDLLYAQLHDLRVKSGLHSPPELL
jgi:hypothetical protein